MLFAEIHGLEEVKERLINAVANNKVPHAQLFLGTEGSANLSFALAYATFLNCNNRQEKDACGECSSCRSNAKFSHPDMHFVYPVCAVKNITGKDLYSSKFMPEWRTFLSNDTHGNIDAWMSCFGGENKQPNIPREEGRQIIKNLSLTSFDGKYKVMIIWLPEYMNATSANSILKILEEPPDNTVFLMVSNDHEKLLTTILSRVQLVQIRPYSIQEVSDMLIQKTGIDSERALRLAGLADGNINTAVLLVDENLEENGEFFKNWLRQCFGNKFAELVERTDEFQKFSKVKQRNFIEYGLSVMRETLVASIDDSEKINRFQNEDLAFVRKFKTVLNSTQIGNVSKLLNDAHYHLERNANAKITFLNLSLNVARALKA